MPAFSDLPLEDGRRGLLKWIEQSRPQGSVNNQVIVIFDGHPGYFSDASLGGIRVIFSDGCTADDMIKSMVDDDDDRKNCVVVTDDKDIFLYARSLGARVMSVAAFTSSKSRGIMRQDHGTKYISLSRQEKINKELKDIWLKEK